MANHPIQLYSGNTTSGRLTMSDGRSTDADRGDQISWSIGQGNVASFHIAGKSPVNIFTRAIPTSNGTILNLDVSSSAPSGDWKYSIMWIDTQLGQMHTDDPKIAVKPVKFNFTMFIALMASAIISLLTVTFFRRKKDKE
ncbi:MAG: hypothetical protein M3Z92_04780 [Bacteroidota bacterium]|nr:hypothetical protein [Bacteroidota bacterium]